MLCSKCKNDNPADASFCEECGSKLESRCASCGAPLSPGESVSGTSISSANLALLPTDTRALHARSFVALSKEAGSTCAAQT